MKKSELTSMTVAELKALAKEQKIKLPAGAKKADIVDALLGGGPSAEAAAAPRKPAGKKKPAEKKPAPERKPAAKKHEPEAPVRAPKPEREWKMPAGTEEPLMARDRAAESKFYTGPEEQHHVPPPRELPREYGEDRITFMARDPYWAFTYWEATPSRIDREKAWFGWDSKLAVRIYDITGVQFDGKNATGYYDQEVFERAGEWYFDLGRPNHSFCADIGLLAPDGRYLTLARSNTVTMPRDTVSDVIDEEWMLLDEDYWKIYGFGEGSSPMEREAWRRRMMRMHGITSPGISSPSRTRRK